MLGKERKMIQEVNLMKLRDKILSLAIGASLLAGGISVQAETPSPDEAALQAGPPDAGYQLLFADEFDKEIDPAVWMYRTGERLGGYNLPENVYVKDGRMYQDIKYAEVNGQKEVTGGGVISKQLFGYGYYETKCTLFSATGGMHNSFWSMGLNDGDGVTMPELNTVYEIDGYEVESSAPNDITCHVNTYIGERRGHGGTPSKDVPSDQEFVLGYEWLPNQVNWYLNGKLIQTTTADDFPIHYAQQNLWVTGLAHTDQEPTEESKVPGSSSWDYVRFYAQPLKDINLLGASEFEYNINPDFGVTQDPQKPMSWMEIGDKDASFIEANKSAVGGNNVLAHRSNEDYKVTTAQRLYYIGNGNYNFEAYAMSSGGQKECKVRISDVGGDVIKEVDIPQADEMTKIEINDIDITSNGAYIEIISDASKDQWMLIDNVNLYATEGRVVEKAVPYSTDLTGKTVGETVVTNEDDGWTTGGEWLQSGQPGYYKNVSTYAFGEEDEWGQFEIVAEEDANYDLKFYKVVHPNSTNNMYLSYTAGDKTVETSLDLTAGESGWVVLDNLDLKAGDKVTVRVDSRNGGGVIRASAVALDSGSLSLNDVIVMGAGKSHSYVYGKSTPIDENDPNVKPEIVNDRTLVPIRFIAEQLGAEVGYNMETTEVSIKTADKEIILIPGEKDMKVNGETISLDVAPMIRHDRTLVPLRAVSEALDKKVTWIPDKYIIIGDKEYKDTEEIRYFLFSIM